MADKFGEYPLQLSQGDEAGTYKVASQFASDADTCGINQVFSAERLEIMKARGLAYGYQVEVVDAQDTPASAPKNAKDTAPQKDEWQVS